jgi:hypothetical protein
VTTRDRSPWHRDDLPPWAWTAIVVMRLAQVVAALVPLALVILLWWTWTHRHDPRVRHVVRSAAKQAGALADSLGSVLR